MILVTNFLLLHLSKFIGVILSLNLQHTPFFFWFNRLVAGAHTIKCEKVECHGSNSDPCINFAMSLPTELSSRELNNIHLYHGVKELGAKIENSCYRTEASSLSLSHNFYWTRFFVKQMERRQILAP